MAACEYQNSVMKSQLDVNCLPKTLKFSVYLFDKISGIKYVNLLFTAVRHRNVSHKTLYYLKCYPINRGKFHHRTDNESHED